MASRGNPNPKGSKPDKLWRDAIMRAVHRVHGDGKARRLEVLADAIVDAGIAGDIAALREIGDRLDGKAHQTSEVTINRARAEELSDDELASIAAERSGEGAVAPPLDPSQLN